MSIHTFLRLIHILSGALWTGTVVFVAAMFIPAMRAVGPSAAPVMREVMENRKMPIWLMLAGVLTVISGISLAWIDAGTLGMDWFKRGAGFVFGLGATSAILALVVGMAVNAPAGRRMSALMAKLAKEGRPPSDQEAAEIRSLQGRLFNATRFVALLLVVAAGFMSVARSFG
jgi:uncharacterized membrane protein